MVTSVKENTDVSVKCPDANADFAWSAGGYVCTGERFLQGDAVTVEHTFGTDGPVAGEDEAIEARRTGTDEYSVVIVAAAQAGTGSNFGVIIVREEVLAQAEHGDSALDGDGQAVVFHGGAGLVGSGDVPERGVGEIILEQNVAEAGAHLGGGGFGGY